MFLGNTQKKQLINELKLNNREDIVNNILGDETKFKHIKFTDEDSQQVAIMLDEDTYIYSQQVSDDYDWHLDNKKDGKYYLTDTINLNNYTEVEQNNEVSSYYGSLERLKNDSC
ncbi:hypothetical protein CP985_11790 [Malaciobacter mytili LMG 24559]|uniref:Haemolysin-type calcium binding-related domain-containing protein n=1 Tax=Malaciobacter mytili LMG 24559 TaxID=1032238 RepID=A0AAX2AFA9_9BACT|nr:hypothetical protein [Malaciobacter mytili]AXH16355.1 hypothetical protein AMYT_a0055 [Malaciobacter mytili LMG 24559]RXK14794.1 hypothetical protein CP985_11790 [Malaciobacter mytili LMG 24559]